LNGDDSSELCEFPQKVLKAFERGVAQVKEKDFGFVVNLYDEPFVYPQGVGDYRERYIGGFCAWLSACRGERAVVVLVDPDTGLQRGKRGPEYVKSGELRKLFDSLKSGDWLVLYQHAPRKENWIGADRSRVGEALNLKADEVLVFDCEDISGDVAFFAARKGGGE